MNIFSLADWTAVGVTAFWAAVIAALGYIIGWIAELITKKILRSLYYEEWFKAHGVDEALLGIPTTDLIAGIVKWWVFLGFFAQAIGLFTSMQMIVSMAVTLYNIYVSLAIGTIYLLIGALLAKYVGIKMREAKTYGGELSVKIVQAIILYFAIVTALPYYGVHDVRIITEALEIAMWGLAGALAIGLGIAICLGSQDYVKDFLKKHRKDIEEMFGVKKA
jgi:hypothetical protein